MRNKTLLIGLDGATFSVLDPLMAEGVMPFLSSFLAQGVRAELRTIVPALTPPAWTSLMTGRTPGQHGVFDFFRMESPESRHIRFFTSQDVGCDTIWSLASDNDLRVTALNFPSMFPAPHLNGYVVPGWVPWRQLRLACWPDNLFDRLKSVPGFNPRELAMDIKLEEKATEGCSNREEYAPWIQFHIRRERNWYEILRHLQTDDPSALTAVLFDGTDKLQHLCWRFIRPQDAQPLEEDWEFEVRRLCLEYFRELDGLLARMHRLAGPETTVVIASDHGFGPTQQVFHVNTWLEKHGYLKWSEAAAETDSDGAVLGVGKVARHSWLLDWNKTKAFAATPTSNGVHIVVARNGDSPGVAPEEYSAFRHRLSRELRDFRDPVSGMPVVTRIWTREEAFDGPNSILGPDLTLELFDGGLVSILPSADPVSMRPNVSGAHRPNGVFTLSGPGVRKGVELAELSILDVAPLVLYSLGLPVPETMQGEVPREAFEPAALLARPVEKVAVAGQPAAGVSSPGFVHKNMDAEAELVVLERLRELGYIE